MELSPLRALMANIAISFSTCFPKNLNKAFLVLNFKFFTQHETLLHNSRVLTLHLTLIHNQAAAFKLGALVLLTK